MQDFKRIALVGPGAVGCAVTALLPALEILDVTICARTAFDVLVATGIGEAAIRKTLPVETDSARIEAPFDLVLLATKTHQTPATADWLAVLCGPNTTVAVLQNGITHRERVAPLVGHATVLPVVVDLPVDRNGPGVVHVTAMGRLTVPDDDSGRRFEQLFVGSPLSIQRSGDWHSAAWQKLVLNCALGAVSALTMRSNRVVRDPAIARLCAELAEEAACVARADGAEVAEGIGRTLVAKIAAAPAEHVPSIAADRIAGRRSEWDARNEEIVRRAKQHGIDVPLTRAMSALLQAGEPAEA